MPESTPAGDAPTPVATTVRRSIADARYLLLVAAPLGALVGCAVAGYDWVVNDVLWAGVTAQPLAVQLVSPFFAMLVAGLVLHAFRVRSSAMADEVVQAYHEGTRGMPLDTAPAKLAASVATLGLGASAGMEGASKWLGATVGSAFHRLAERLGMRLDERTRRTTLLTGGSAGIAAIFRAPLSGAVMGVESPFKRDLALDALVPSLVAAATSFWTFTRFRPSGPYFPIRFAYRLESADLLVALAIGLAAGLASHLFLATLAVIRRRAESAAPTIWIRTAIGGAALVALAWAGQALLGTPVTLQSGLPVANQLLNGHFALAACAAIFALKLLATAVTFGTGGVGGLFVPTATIGAALGACFDATLAPSHPGVYTILGIAAFAGASYNSLLFAAVFIAETTGNVFLVVPALLATSVAFVTAAGVSNSRAQRDAR